MGQEEAGCKKTGMETSASMPAFPVLIAVLIAALYWLYSVFQTAVAVTVTRVIAPAEHKHRPL